MYSRDQLAPTSSYNPYDISLWEVGLGQCSETKRQDELKKIRENIDTNYYSIKCWLKLLTLRPKTERLDELKAQRDAYNNTLLHYCAQKDCHALLLVLEKLPEPQRWEALSSIENGSHQTVLHLVATHQPTQLLLMLQKLPPAERWTELQRKNQYDTILDAAFRHRDPWPSNVLQFLLNLPNVSRQMIEPHDTLNTEDDFLSNLDKLQSCFTPRGGMHERCKQALARWKHFNELYALYLSDSAKQPPDSADVNLTEVNYAVKNLTRAYRKLEMQIICMQPRGSTQEFSQTLNQLNQHVDKLKKLILTPSFPMQISLTIGRLVGALIGGITAFIIGFAVVSAVIVVAMAVGGGMAAGPMTSRPEVLIPMAMILGLIGGIAAGITGVKKGASGGEQLAYKLAAGSLLTPPQRASYECAELALTNAQLVVTQRADINRLYAEQSTPEYVSQSYTSQL